MKIPDRLRLEVLGYMDGVCQRCIDPKNRRPIILMVVGAPGTGKSVMTKAILEEVNIEVNSIPASLFAGPHEGESIRPFRDKIIELGYGKQNRNLPPKALIIEDFDRGLGGRDDTEGHTVNSNLLITELMRYADNPFQIDIPGDIESKKPAEAFPVRPTAIIMTVNDTTRIHTALRRFGRARVIQWTPNTEETEDMVANIFALYTKEQISSLVSEFQSQPIGFYEALKSEIEEHFTREALALYAGPMRDAFNELAIRERLKHAMDSVRTITVEDAIDLGKAMRDRQVAANFLSAKGSENVTPKI